MASILPQQSPLFSTPTSLQIKFIAQQPPQPVSRHSAPNGEGSQHTRNKEQQATTIDLSLLQYQHHYLKDIQSYFPSLQFKHILLCPLIKTQPHKVCSAHEWRHRMQSNPNYTQHWFAVFCSSDNSNMKQYTQYPVQLIAIILQEGFDSYLFLGYVPAHYHIIDMIKAMCGLFQLTLRQEADFISQFSSEYQGIQGLLGNNVQEVSGSYIMVRVGGGMAQAMATHLNNELQDLVDQNQLYEAVNMASQQLQNIETDLGVSSQLWHSNTDIQTCFQVKKQSRSKLISVKNMEELDKMRSKVKLNIENPSIDLPMDGEEEMEDKLKILCEQIKKYIDVKY